jgi:D-cysteine desulfhydrase
LHPRPLRRHCQRLPGGASTPSAVLAFVNAALELRAQVDAKQLPEPAEIVVAAGSLSTCAGLALGCAIAGLSTRVTGVRVMQQAVLGGLVPVCTPAVARRQMQRAAHALGWEGRLPEPLLLDGEGAGYGVPTPQTEQTIAQFRDAWGIALECTYTAKAAACALQRLRTGAPVLLWHTFNSRPLDALPRAACEHPFPPPIARALAQHPGDTP